MLPIVCLFIDYQTIDDGWTFVDDHRVVHAWDVFKGEISIDVVERKSGGAVSAFHRLFVFDLVLGNGLQPSY